MIKVFHQQITKLIIIGIIGSICICSSVQAAKKKEINHAENAYQAGMMAYKKNDYQNAIYAFQNSLEYDSQLYKSHYMLGLSLFMNNEPQPAIQALKKAMSEFPKEWKAQALLGEYYTGIKEYDLAIMYYQNALSSSKMKGGDKKTYQSKLNEIQQLQENLWRVSEEEKSKILKSINIELNQQNWWPIVVEKRNENLHLVYSLKEEDYQTDRWKTIVDVMCYTSEKDKGFNFINEKIATYYRSFGGELISLQDGIDSRLFETRTTEKPRLTVLGRIFNSPLGYCVAQMQSRTKLKEKDKKEWIRILNKIQLKPIH